MSAPTVVEKRMQTRKLRRMSAPAVVEGRLQTTYLRRMSAPAVVEGRLQTTYLLKRRLQTSFALDVYLDRIRR
jgi:hypothetical protein